MNIELYIDGQLADLDKKDFAYTLQVNNLFDFNTREFSYSDVLYLPTTPNNSQIFGFADIPASDNRGAYKRYIVDFYVNGIAITLRANGFLMGKRGDRFIFDFKENSKDMFQLMVGKKLKDLPLEELKHEKENTIIIAQHQREQTDAPNLLYAVADYGGETTKRNIYNFDYCPPSIKMDWILQKIKELNPENPYIFRSKFFDSQFWKSLYITVSDVEKVQRQTLLSDAVSTTTKIDIRTVGTSQENPARRPMLIPEKNTKNENLHLFTETVTEGRHNRVTGIAGGIFKKGKYLFEIKADKGGLFYTYHNRTDQSGIFLLRAGDKEIFRHEVRFTNLEDYTETAQLTGGFSPSQGINKTFEVDLKEDTPIYWESITYNHSQVRYKGFEMFISFKKEIEVDVKNKLSDLSLIDWFKEVLNLFSLTPMKDDKTNNIQQFYTLSQRVNEAPILDWSDKFIRITEEKYHDTSAYGQVNKFKYSKYNDEGSEQTPNDAEMIFNDPAIIFQKEFKSKLYSPAFENYTFGNKKTDTFQMWTREIKQTDKEFKIEYKENKGRFHMFQAVKETSRQKATLDILKQNFELPKPFVADFNLLRWENLLKNYHSDLPRLMENLHLITCEFALTELDIHNFSFFSRIYVEQFGHYFLPNKIIYRPEKLAVVEMIKIRS